MNDLKMGMLQPVLELAKSDDTLSLAIRDEYINIYYRGGSIMKIERKRSRYCVDFNLN